MSAFSDDFNRADGALVGGNWVDFSGSSALTIVSNRVVDSNPADASTTTPQWTTQCATQALFSQVTFSMTDKVNSGVDILLCANSGFQSGIYCRYTAVNDTWIIRDYNGSGTTRATVVSALAINTSYVVRAEYTAAGDCTIYVNGSSVLTFSYGTTISADGNYQKGVGFGLRGNGAADDWSGGDLVSGNTAVINNTFNVAASGINGRNPHIAASNTIQGTSLGTNRAVTKPASTTGDLVLVFVAHDQPSTTAITASTGWTAVGTAQVQGTNVIKAAVFGRVLDGSGSDTLTISGTTQDYVISCLVVVAAEHRYTNATINTIPVAAAVSSTNGNGDPPSLTPSGGSDDYLWIVADVVDQTATSAITAVPANFTQVTNATSSAGSTTAVIMATAYRRFTGSTLDPGTFTNPSRPWISYTIAIQPPSAGGTGSVVINNTFNPVAAGKRTPKGSATINDAFDPVTVGKRVPKGLVVVNNSFNPVALGKRVPKGLASISDTFDPSASGKRFPKGSAVVNDAFDPVAFGKRFPQGSAVITDTFNPLAAGQAPVVGGAAGSAIISDTFNPTATGKRTPKGSGLVSDAFDPTATGKRTPKGSATVSDTFNAAAAGKRVPKGATTITDTFNPTAAGKRVPKGAGVVNNQWAVQALGFAPQVGVNQGNGSISDQWDVSATGKRTPKGTAAASDLWQVTAAGVAPVVPQHLGAATVATVWPVAAAGARMSKGPAAAYAAWALEAFGDSTGLLGVLNGIGFVEWMYEGHEIVDWLVGA